MENIKLMSKKSFSMAVAAKVNWDNENSTGIELCDVMIACKPWKAESRRTHRVRSDRDGGIMVYDDLARSYTRCHSLGRSAASRIYRALLEII